MTRLRPIVLLLVLVAAAPASSAPVPAAGPATVFAGGLDGPEGLAFLKDGTLAVGSTTGRITRLEADGSASVLAEVGEEVAGLTTLRDGRLLAAAFGGGRIWAIDPDTGFVSVYASGVPGANFIVETRKRRVFASASLAGTIVDVTGGTPVEAASGLSFPNGLALGGDGYLYVAELALSRIVRLPLSPQGTLGPAEVYATGTIFVDGIAFDRRGNLLAVGQDTLWVVDATTRVVTVLSSDPLFEWPANLAFGRGRGFGKRDLFLANFGPALGDGTNVVRVPYSLRGAKLSR
jgi:sugar lactone lactonase YvrE